MSDVEKARVDARFARGQCRSCPGPLFPGRRHCRRCLLRMAAVARELRRRQRRLGRCSHPGCPDPPEPGRARCKPHREQSLADKQKYRERRRAEQSPLTPVSP